jgi:quinol monooxygenase YgiN
MSAFNVVKFRVKPGREQEFLDAHQPQNVRSKWPGWKRVDLIQTGDRSYCVIGEWEDMATMAAARPNMIATLNSFRDTLEDLGGGLGVTDAVSGPVVIEIRIDSMSVAPDRGAQVWRKPWDESSSIAVKRPA